MGEKRVKPKSEQDVLAEAEKVLATIQTKKQEAVPEKDKEEVLTKKKTIVRKKKAKTRSKKYQLVYALVDRNKFYDARDALELAQKSSYSKFEGSIELHLKLKPSKNQEQARGLIKLPYPVDKKLKLTIVTEELINKIASEGRTDYDILVATPAMMPSLAKIAKILGPQGKMPNPKSGTIGEDPQRLIEEIQKGKTEYKTDKNGVIHLIIGKKSWDIERLYNNLQSVLSVIPRAQLRSAAVCATMGPGIKVKL